MKENQCAICEDELNDDGECFQCLVARAEQYGDYLKENNFADRNYQHAKKVIEE